METVRERAAVLVATIGPEHAGLVQLWLFGELAQLRERGLGALADELAVFVVELNACRSVALDATWCPAGDGCNADPTRRERAGCAFYDRGRCADSLAAPCDVCAGTGLDARRQECGRCGGTGRS